MYQISEFSVISRVSIKVLCCIEVIVFAPQIAVYGIEYGVIYRQRNSLWTPLTAH